MNGNDYLRKTASKRKRARALSGYGNVTKANERREAKAIKKGKFKEKKSVIMGPSIQMKNKNIQLFPDDKPGQSAVIRENIETGDKSYGKPGNKNIELEMALNKAAAEGKTTLQRPEYPKSGYHVGTKVTVPGKKGLQGATMVPEIGKKRTTITTQIPDYKKKGRKRPGKVRLGNVKWLPRNKKSEAGY